MFKGKVNINYQTSSIISYFYLYFYFYSFLSYHISDISCLNKLQQISLSIR